jgi:hypothetical protein
LVKPTDKLTDWFVKAEDPNGYTVLCGYSEKRQHKITTSNIVAAHGRLVRTYSGSVYELGEPNERYRLWLGDKYDPINPVRVRR